MVQLARDLRVLLLEGIHPKAKDQLERDGFKVQLVAHSPAEEDLIPMLKNYDVVGIRSKTQLTEKVLAANPHLLVAGAFCIGTDQVNSAVSNRMGMPVFNAPYSNTRSVAELVLCEIVALSRQLGDRNSKAHAGVWLKSASGAHEVRGKMLGIVGYGHIGSQVSVLAESFGMRVVYFDVIKKLPLGNSQPKESLEEVLRVADFVTLHVPDTAQTKDLIGALQLQQMKKGAHLINASRGSVVKIDELVKSMHSGHIAGAAVDVFPSEPASNNEKFISELQGIPNVILTPHIGGSTEEAQEAIGVEVALSLAGFLLNGSTRGAVNFPNVDLPVIHAETHRMLNVHRNVPGVLGEINGIVSDLGVNIEAQYLSTDANIGYLVMDFGRGAAANEAAARVGALKTSIKTRLLR